MTTRTWLLAFVLGFILVIRMTSAASGGLPEQLEQCQADLAAAEDALAVALADLADCEASNFQLPGDGVSGPSLSFTTNSDGTVTDNNLGLRWERKTNTAGDPHEIAVVTYNEAQAFVAGLNTQAFAGFTDWRLPRFVELSLVQDYGRSAPTIATSGILTFSPSSALNVWTSTPGPGPNEAGHFVVDVRNGTYSWFQNGFGAFVIAVR